MQPPLSMAIRNREALSFPWEKETTDKIAFASLIFRHSPSPERAVNRLRRFLPSSSAWLPLSPPPLQTFSGRLFGSTNLLQEAAKIKSKKFRYLCIEFRQNKALPQTRQVIYDGVSEISKL